MKPKSAEPHYYQLDIFRALAALSVFMFHWFGASFGRDELPWRGWWRDWSQAPDAHFLWLYPLSFGWMGVPLFFVISGFCIHLGWASGKPLTAGQFYWRRFWRIVPTYWVILSFFVWHSWASMKNEPALAGNLASHFLFCFNLDHRWFFSILNSFWSLAVEVQFYLVYPLLLLWRNRWPMEKILWSALALGIAGRIIPLWWRGQIINDPIYCSNTWVLWFDWLLGAAIAERMNGGRRLFRHPARWLGICGLLLLVANQFLPLAMFSFSLASVCAAVGVEHCLVCPPALPRRLGRALTLLGICSYSFYLLHQRLLGSVLFHWAPKSFSGQVAAGLCALALVAVLSGLSYWLLEKNSLRLGKHWGYRLFPGKRQTSLDTVSGKIGLPL